MFNRALAVDEQLRRLLREAGPAPHHRGEPSRPVRAGFPLTGAELLELFDSQMVSRHLDLMARRLRAVDQGYYTIGSAGHEGNAVVGRVTRHTDPAFLHYRSGALLAERARKLPEQHFVRDALLACVASRDDPIAGGRHKVWGSRPLWVLPQTSTIASHLPKAVGTAIAIDRCRRLSLPMELPADSIVVASFGDASTHHSVAQGAFNAALFASRQQVPVPILFVCEDNSIGISVPTPPDWIEQQLGQRAGLKYLRADGADIVAAHAAARQAVDYCRERRRPVLLHLEMVRLLGHAGSDLEATYRSLEEIEAAEARDPLLATARLILQSGLASAPELLARYEQLRWHVEEEAGRAAARPKLGSTAEIAAPLAPYHPAAVAEQARRRADDARRHTVFGERLPEQGPPRHMAVQINRALTDLMLACPDIVLFGEDVARKGGVYHVTAGLLDRFGPARVFNTILDETSILGLAQGFATVGLLPLAEIQYLAYLHNAIDQLRGEACSLQYFSSGQFQNPLVVRIAALGYQKGFGGHFHNDNSIAALREIPGLVLACPARGDDAAKMLRTSVALARADGRQVAFLEPIALYMTRDLYETADEAWLTAYPPPDETIALGEGQVYHEDGTDLAIITYANGVHLSLRAARWLRREYGIHARVVDLRWLAPLNEDFIAAQARCCGRVVIVDEGRRSAGIGEAIATAIVERCRPCPPVARITGADTFIPLGPAARLVLPSEDGIVSAALELTLGA